jgi:hypothetical protein
MVIDFQETLDDRRGKGAELGMFSWDVWYSIFPSALQMYELFKINDH